MSGPEVENHGDPEPLSLDSKVSVPLEEVLDNIANKAGFAAADRVMDLHMDTVHPPIETRLGAVETRVEAMRPSFAKIMAVLVLAVAIGGLAAKIFT